MKLVAVLDLMRGQAVHARRGERHAYQPVESRLGSGSDVPALARALLRLHPFHAIYIADLDAILGRGDNLEVMTGVAAAIPATPLWVDAGIADGRAVQALRAALPAATVVVGSESIVAAQWPNDLDTASCHFILSLDFKAGVFRGPPDLLQSPARWPRRVLAMNLDRVGSGEGPDMDLLAQLQARKPNAEVFAAGGVRCRGDLETLKAAGVAGALIASALHDGRLSAADLAACA